MTRGASRLRRRLDAVRLEDRINCSNFMVKNTLDFMPDFDQSQPLISTPIPGSLRWAVRMANETPGGGTVTFNTDPLLGTDFDDPNLSPPPIIKLEYGTLRIGKTSYVKTNGETAIIENGNPVKILAPRHDDPTKPYVTVQWAGSLHGSASINGAPDALYGSDWSVVSIDHVARQSDTSGTPGYNLPDYSKTIALNGLIITKGEGSEGAGIAASGVFKLEITESWVTGNSAKRYMQPNGVLSEALGGGLKTSGFAFGGMIRPKYAPTVIVTNSIFEGNGTYIDDDEPDHTNGIGGAMHLAAGTSLLISDSTVTKNAAENGSAGIYFQGGANDPLAFPTENPHSEYPYSYLSIRSCEFSLNTISSVYHGGSGGGITIDGPAVGYIANTTFLKNIANTNGGAVELTGGLTTLNRVGQVHIVNCTLDGNEAAVNNSKLKVIAKYGEGGAISSVGNANELIIVNSTFSGNEAQYGRGGAIYVQSLRAPSNERQDLQVDYNQGTIIPAITPSPPWDHRLRFDIYNSTFAFNHAGGAYVEGEGLLGAQGGAIALDLEQGPPGEYSITSTIIAKNTVPSVGEGADVWVSSAVFIPGQNANPSDLSGHNVIGIADDGNATFPGSQTGSVLLPLGPELVEYDFHNVNVKTKNWSITTSSPAFNKGANPLNLQQDQHAVARVRADFADVGSYEALPMVFDVADKIYAKNNTYTTEFKTQRSMIGALYAYTDELAPEADFHVYRIEDSLDVQAPGEVPINEPFLDLTYPASGSFNAPWGAAEHRYIITFKEDGPNTYEAFMDSGVAGTGIFVLEDGMYAVNATIVAGTPPVLVDMSDNFLFGRLFGDANEPVDPNNPPPVVPGQPHWALITDLTDFVSFRDANGSSGFGGNYDLAFDINGDGNVDLIDFIQFRLRLGLELYPITP